jgi:multidrug efflux pump subunit AcrA (membrane-fusion protein)
LTNFYLGLLLLVLLIVLSNILQTPPSVAESQDVVVKEIAVFNIGSVPKMIVQAQIEKTGVVTVVSLSGGVVQKVHYLEGDEVAKGNTLVSLSTNYQGGNASSVQRELANTQYQSTVDTFGLQTELLNVQREVATQSAENAERLRDITADSRGRTRELIDFNKSLLEDVNEGLAQLESAPEADADMLAALQGQKAQLLAGLGQAESGLASADYQADDDRPPAELARLQKDLALKQLELQEKMLDVTKETSRLQLQLAQVTEAMMYPSAPVSGVVQRVFVHEGDVVSPGTPLVVVAQDAAADPVTAVAYVSEDIAGQISMIEPSVLHLGEQTLEEIPYFISTEAVQGTTYAAYYAVPDSMGAGLTDDGFVEVEIPVGYAETTGSVTFVPVDAVYQTADSAHVFVVEENKAKSKTVTLGGVHGSFVEVLKGIMDGDEVIVSRNVVEGDRVRIQN